MILRALVLVVVASLAAPWPAIPCSCLKGTLKGALEGSDAVFVGKVIRLEVLRRENGVDNVRAVLEPLEVVKGSLPREVAFVTNNCFCGDCSFWFNLRETYLIFARDFGGTLTTNACSRSRRIKDAPDDIKALGLERFLTHRGQSGGRFKDSSRAASGSRHRDLATFLRLTPPGYMLSPPPGAEIGIGAHDSAADSPQGRGPCAGRGWLLGRDPRSAGLFHARRQPRRSARTSCRGHHLSSGHRCRSHSRELAGNHRLT
jgi:hypothetical protein